MVVVRLSITTVSNARYFGGFSPFFISGVLIIASFVDRNGMLDTRYPTTWYQVPATHVERTYESGVVLAVQLTSLGPRDTSSD